MITHQPPNPLVPIANDLPSRSLPGKRLFTAPELIRLAGMSRKQVTYWAKVGLIRPTFHDSHVGPGQPALFYSVADVVKALVAFELRHAGFTLRQVKQVLLNVDSMGIDLSGSHAYLLTDGHSVYAAYSEGEVVDVLKHHRQMLLLVPIHEQVAKVLGAA